MKIIFMGTPAFSVPVLESLAEKHEIAAVLTQAPKPVGRGKKIDSSPVQKMAESLNIPVLTPRSLRKEPEVVEHLKTLNADVVVVCAYGLILPKSVLELCPMGAINIHASLLPRWRGAAPMERAIMAGDTETGITIMQMDEGLDTGDMLLVEKCPITAETTIDDLKNKMSEIGCRLILKVLDEKPSPIKQPEDGNTYAEKLKKEDYLFNPEKSAFELDCAVRALGGLSFFQGNDKISLIKVTPQQWTGNDEIGTVINGKTIVCGNQTALSIETIQRSGKRAMPIDDFLRGYHLTEKINATV